MNETILDMLPGDVETYLSVDQLEVDRTGGGLDL